MRGRYTRELLQDAVNQSNSMAELMRVLGLKEASHTRVGIKRHLTKHAVDINHFTTATYRKTNITKRYTDEELFIINSHISPRNVNGMLKRRLIKKGRKEICETCGIGTVWNNKPLTLHLDHINGNSQDNRECNLRFLCPNCHTQTKTYAGKDRSTRKEQ